MECNSSINVYTEDSKTRVKEELLNQDETQDPNLQHCNMACEVRIKQENLDATEAYLIPCLGSDVVKTEIKIKEESKWCYGTSTEEKLAECEKNETVEDLPTSESPRLPTPTIYPDGSCAPFLDMQEEASDHKTVCENNGISSRHNNHLETQQSLADVSAQIYKCEICEKCYSQRSSLQRHTMVHSGKSRYKCDRCERYFTQKSELQRHELLHSGTKPYKCDTCNKCFTQKPHLDSHVLCHSGIKSHHCHLCNKSFTRKSDLKKHILLHSGTKSHKCDVCEKCFAKKSTLQSHKVLHSGIKPHKCDICDKFFSRKSSLVRHTSQHSTT